MRYRALEGLPEGTVSAHYFIVRHGVRRGAHPGLLRDHIVNGIDGERIEVTEIPHGENGVRRYLTPDQQSKALAFWDRHGIKYRKPAVKVEGASCQ